MLNSVKLLKKTPADLKTVIKWLLIKTKNNYVKNLLNINIKK